MTKPKESTKLGAGAGKTRKTLPKARKLKNTNDLKKVQGGKNLQTQSCISCQSDLKMMICS